MKKSNLFILYLLSLVFIACGGRSEIVSEPKEVYLYLKDNDTLLKSVVLDITDRNDFRSANSFIKNKENHKEIAFSFPLSHPTLLCIKGIYSFAFPLMIYVTPGDTISFSADKNHKIVFEGKNAAHYNFFAQLSNEKLLYPQYNPKQSPEEYKQAVTKVYQQKLYFLNKYSKQENASDDFLEKMRCDFRYEYIYTLLQPKEIVNPEYLSPITISNFDREDMLDSWSFRSALMNYISIDANKKKKFPNYSKEKLNAEVKYINKHLSGKVLQYALSKTIILYHKNLRPDLVNPLKELIINQLPHTKDTIQKKELELIYKELHR